MSKSVYHALALSMMVAAFTLPMVRAANAISASNVILPEMNYPEQKDTETNVRSGNYGSLNNLQRQRNAVQAPNKQNKIKAR